MVFAAGPDLRGLPHDIIAKESLDRFRRLSIQATLRPC
jgi:hypothetical protein